MQLWYSALALSGLLAINGVPIPASTEPSPTSADLSAVPVQWPSTAFSSGQTHGAPSPAASPVLTNSERIQRGLPLAAPANLWTEKRALLPRFSAAPGETSTDDFTFQSCYIRGFCDTGCTENTLNNPARYGIASFRTDVQRQNAVDDCATFCTGATPPTAASAFSIANAGDAITCYCDPTIGAQLTCTDEDANFAYYTKSP